MPVSSEPSAPVAPAFDGAPMPVVRVIPQDEKDLYPLVSGYLFSIGITPLRIDDKKSSYDLGGRGNQWLHPDIVGMEGLSASWGRSVSDCVAQMGGRKARLWSVEVKWELTRKSVRDDFFQTVSNSSWANVGYLAVPVPSVPKSKSEDENTGKDLKKILSELRILSDLHGIGVILLDWKNPVDSQIVFPARERSDVDWNAANRLADQNSHFRDFLKLVENYLQVNKTYPSEWDIPDDMLE